MPVWGQILAGMAALAIFFMLWPGAKAAMQESKEAENPDWMGALVPVVVVVLFVILLILMAKG